MARTCAPRRVYIARAGFMQNVAAPTARLRWLFARGERRLSAPRKEFARRAPTVFDNHRAPIRTSDVVGYALLYRNPAEDLWKVNQRCRRAYRLCSTCRVRRNTVPQAQASPCARRRLSYGCATRAGSLTRAEALCGACRH